MVGREPGRASAGAFFMNRNATPAVSVGMPAYNSAATIRAAVECLLAQGFADFELIISDNASTDRTWTIIEEYAGRDPRVRGIRQPRNIGANGNYSAVFRAARGRYFKWASSNDWCAPEFLGRCVDHLDSHPDTVLVAPRTRIFQGDISNWQDYPKDIAFEQADPVERFKAVAGSLALNNVINGLVRTAALRRTRLIDHYPGADVVLVGHLALLGRIALLEAPLFYRRLDRETATSLMSSDAVHRHHYPTQTARSLFPAWRFAMGWARAAASAGLSAPDTARALAWTLRMAWWDNAGLRHDLLTVLRRPVGE